jgi:Arc/MetJ-type ribon-helix-helix transcriptional regulator
MGAETKITVTLPAEIVADLEADVAEGRFPSPDAAIVAALEEAAARRVEAEIGVERLRELLEEAEGSPSVDGNEVFDRLIAKYEAMARDRGQ